MSPRRAFTLVELLVVIAIIGTLVALLLPAIQAARETARRAQCAGHLGQLALASLNHETAYGHYPTGGWGYQWIGEPDAGYGKDQPGGWAYNLLAFIEQPALRKLGHGIADADERQEQLKVVVTTPLDIFQCPSKRPVQLYPIDKRHTVLAYNLYNCRPDNDCQVARGDYRINGGNIFAADQTGPGANQDLTNYKWWADGWVNGDVQSGVSYQRSMIRVAQITDGTSNTILLGEKALRPEKYLDGTFTADDQCVYSGHDNDNVGYTGERKQDVFAPQPDQQPNSIQDLAFRFGGPHPSGFNMSRCDGSVSFMAFVVDGQAFWLLGGRNDSEN